LPKGLAWFNITYSGILATRQIQTHIIIRLVKPTKLRDIHFIASLLSAAMKEGIAKVSTFYNEWSSGETLNGVFGK